MQDRNLKYILFILIQSLIYGFGNPLTKTAYETITPLWLIALRFTISTVLFLLVFRKHIFADTLWLKSAVWLPSALCCAGAYITCNIALNITTATNVGFIMSMPVLFAPLLQSLVLRRKYQIRKQRLLLCKGTDHDGLRIHSMEHMHIQVIYYPVQTRISKYNRLHTAIILYDRRIMTDKTDLMSVFLQILHDIHLVCVITR